VRNRGFWTIDWLKGRTVRKHYIDIKNTMQRKENVNKARESLQSLLTHATQNCSFYAPFANTPISEFPIIDKDLIRSRHSEFLAKPFVTAKLHRMSTSGSTGTPFSVVQNYEKRSRVLAEIVYFGELCGYTIGQRYAFIRSWNSQTRKSPLESFLQNLIAIDTSRLDEESLETMRSLLKRYKRLSCILGYASSLDLLTQHLLEKGETPESFKRMKVVISGSELLSDKARRNLKRVFGCNVVSRYSNQENGLIAQEVSDNVFLINRASYYLEFLKPNSNEHARPGELSRIVLTDLFNYAMPMIRYDTGDLAIFDEHPDYGRVITSIEGRVRDFFYDTQDRLLSPSAITVQMWKFDRLRQFQFIQDGRAKYLLKVNGARGVYEDDDFIEVIENIVGKNANITIEHVDGIPQLQSGKFRQVICNYRPS
jgi:phenylacetate-CoA ligase